MSRPKNSKDQEKRKPRVKWSNEDMQSLILLYPNTKNDMIAKVLNKSKDSVKARARALGLKKSSQFYEDLENE